MKTFGELTTQEQRALKDAYADGKTIECSMYGERWYPSKPPQWFENLIYRIKPEENDMCTFGELSKSEKMEIFEAWIDGEGLEYKTHNEWVKVFGNSTPAFYSYTTDRIKPKELIPDSIDWSHVAPEYKWMARDEDGKAYLHIAEPDIGPSEWHSDETLVYGYAQTFASYKQGTVDWKDSLVKRPGGV